MGGIEQITDAAFVHLQGIQSLDMRRCTQITDAAFVHLQGIQSLDMSGRTQITDAAFVHLQSIKSLKMWDRTQITDAAFDHLRCVKILKMTGCRRSLIGAARSAGLNPDYMGWVSNTDEIDLEVVREEEG